MARGWPKGKPRNKKVARAAGDIHHDDTPLYIDPPKDLARGVIGPHSWTVRKDEWGRQIITVKNELGDIVCEEQRRLMSVQKQVEQMVGVNKEAAHADC